MRYTLIEEYFETELFQNTVQKYFDTIFRALISDNIILQAKGKFEVNGKLVRDYFDMPYHIHILNGLIPSLFIYERYLLTKNWVSQPQTENYLKVLMLGFTFHDTNKLLKTETLQEGIKQLEEKANYFKVKDFFPDFDKHKSDIFFLSLSTENRTSVLGNNYKTNLEYSHMKDILSNLCHFADGLASVQEFENLEALYNSVSKCLHSFSKLSLPISYVEVRTNPYTLLSQNLLQNARKVLARNNKKILFATRYGFIFFGEDVTGQERSLILEKASNKSEDINPVDLTVIKAEKCSFGFTNSIHLNSEVLELIIEAHKNKFLLLSPNGKDKIVDFDNFIKFNEQFAATLNLPIEIINKEGRLYLQFKDNNEEWFENFIKIFSLQKIMWLNSNENKKWKKDLEEWLNKNDVIGEIIEYEYSETKDGILEKINVSRVDKLIKYFSKITKSTASLFKTYLNLIKTFQIINSKSESEVEEYIKSLEDDIINHFTEEAFQENNYFTNFFDRYFHYRGNINLNFLQGYNPFIPKKSEMCAFTSALAHKEYKEAVAFAMKARGFSNRTTTTLNNTVSHISDLFSEENQLRKSKFNTTDANMVVYNDFFETSLDIDRDILISCLKAKNNIKILEDGIIEIDKNAKFQYNLYNLDFVKISPDIESNFYFVRRLLLMVKKLGIRSYVTGIMSLYLPHKEAFKFENAPKFLQMLQWDKVHLNEVESILNEMDLIYSLGKSRLNSNLLKIAENRNTYFTIFYLLPEEEKKKTYDKLNNFIIQNKNKFKSMTVTEKLVDLAVEIDLGYKSGSEQTWLIRTALEYLRKNVKQKYSREQVIQQIEGSIYKTLSKENPDDIAIEKFATAVYDELYLKEWKEQLPNINREKDWIYQFGFLYSRKSKELIIQKSDAKIKRQLAEKNLPLTKENIINLLKETKQEHYTEQIVERILN